MAIITLPITTPPIVGLQYHAYSLSALLSYKKFYPWFYSHYIQVFCIDDSEHITPYYNFYSINFWDNGIPYISCNHLTDQKTIIDNNIDLTKLVMRYIDRKWYAYIEIDDFYIPFRRHYKKRHFSHDIFIYGYDTEKECFCTAGFNDNREYSYNSLSYEDFNESYIRNVGSMIDIDDGGNKFIRFFKILEEQDCEFDVVLVKELITDYLNSTDTSKKLRIFRTPPCNRVYGLGTYDVLKRYLNSLMEGKAYYDIRPIHLFWEHKKCMVMRVKYMIENNIIKNGIPICGEFEEIEKKALFLRNNMLKYQVTRNKHIIEHMGNLLSEIRDKEQEGLSKLLMHIESLK